METLVRNNIVDNDIKTVIDDTFVNWSLFENKNFYITGATGTIGSFLTRCLIEANKKYNLNLKVILAVRQPKKVKKFFNREIVLYKKTLRVNKINLMKGIVYNGKVDYIIHCANNTSSKSFVENPVETFNTAVTGTENILKFAKIKNVESMVFLSSMEVYGNVDEPGKLSENDIGAIELNYSRNSYPLGKRGAETLCYLYANEYDLPVKVVRLGQIIGSNVEYNDSRVYAQFARSVVEKKDIILHTTAETTRSYCYITDLISALLMVLTNGQNGEVYNISNENATIKIKDMAKLLADNNKDTDLIFDIKENTPYFKETHWVLDNSKIKSLGWMPKVSMQDMYNRLINSFIYQKKLTNKILYRSFWQKFFSIKNFDETKILTIFGFKISINVAGIYRKLLSGNEVVKNKIIFNNFGGGLYGCNLKYIAEEINKRNLPYELVWIVKEDKLIKKFKSLKLLFPSNIKLVKYRSFECMKDFFTSKIIISNVHLNPILKRGWVKKDEQKYINTWHGSLGIKKIAFSIKNNKPSNSELEIFINRDSQYTDYMISNSEFESEVVYKCGLKANCNILKLGHPRNDIFFKNKEEILKIKEKVCKKYKFNIEDKILLYVPTFRDDKRMSGYNLDVERLQIALKEKYGVNYKILIRMHPLLKEHSNKLFKYSANIKDASMYADIQELLVSSDIAITDYSSCIFDFMLSRKPAFIFATDIDEYNTERGFYYPIETTPFPIATNNDELIENIKQFDYEKYKTKVEQFLIDKGCMEDGHASERVVDLIEDIIG